MSKILFIDTLATGLNPERCAIYRLSGVICEEAGNTLTELQRFDICARPDSGTRIVDNSLWIGGMTRAKLAYLPEQDKAFDDFMKIIQEHINIRNPKDKMFLAGFNISAFDIMFLRSWFIKNKNEKFRDCFYVQAIDLMNQAAFYLMEDRETMPDFHLESTAKALGIAPIQSQEFNPLDNVDTCIMLYLKLKEKLMMKRDIKHDKTKKIVKNHKF